MIKKLMVNKNNILTILIVAVLIISIIGLSACSKPTTPIKNSSNSTQCRTDSQCITLMNKTLKTCTTAYCTSGTCKTRIVPNCCGNNITEEIENGLQGNKCTCPKDYGVCNVTIKYEDASSRMVNAKYIINECVNDECLIEYDKQIQRDLEFFTIWTGSGFVINAYINYPNLFYKDTSQMDIELKLTDYDTEKISGPVVINEIRLMESSKILSKINPSIALSSIGQTVKRNITMTDYDFVYPEEYKTVLLNLDYEYIPLQKKVVDGETVYVELPIERKSYTISLRDRITFLDKSIIIS
ncbi:MAG: hypothetical protein ACP5N1_00480 [Candidatus Woesearchaeota archaeon]